jgi:hypothetical protein
MRFRVTSVASSETGALLRDVTVRVEDWLNASLGDGNFGIGVDQFTIVAISVDDDPNENSRWTKAHDKTGRFKHPITGESVSHISVAVTMPPAKVIASAPIDLLALFCNSSIHRLETRPARVPQGFDYERCSTAISKALAVYVQPVV